MLGSLALQEAWYIYNISNLWVNHFCGIFYSVVSISDYTTFLVGDWRIMQDLVEVNAA